MSSQYHNLLLSSLSSHYKNKSDQRRELLDIVNGSSDMSLRLIDWFVTHYARNKNVVYWIDDANKKLVEHAKVSDGQHLRKFHLYLEYRAQLHSYTKMYFDPFRRYERITFVLEKTPMVAIESTVGQLNFFRWALQNHVIEYIKAHISDIEEAMSSFQSADKVPSEKVKKRVIACKPLNTITHAPCFVHFD